MHETYHHEMHCLEYTLSINLCLGVTKKEEGPDNLLTGTLTTASLKGIWMNILHEK